MSRNSRVPNYSREISPWSNDARPGPSSSAFPSTNQTNANVWQLQKAVADAANEVKELINLRKMQAASSLLAANAGVLGVAGRGLLGPQPVPVQVPAVVPNVVSGMRRNDAFGNRNRESWPSSSPRVANQQRSVEPRRKRSPERPPRHQTDNKRRRTDQQRSNYTQRSPNSFPIFISNADLDFIIAKFAEEVDLRSAAPHSGVQYKFLRRTSDRDAKKCMSCSELVLFRCSHPHKTLTCKNRSSRERLDVLSQSLAFLLWERKFWVVKKVEDVGEWKKWRLDRQKEKIAGQDVGEKNEGDSREDEDKKNEVSGEVKDEHLGEEKKEGSGEEDQEEKEKVVQEEQEAIPIEEIGDQKEVENENQLEIEKTEEKALVKQEPEVEKKEEEKVEETAQQKPEKMEVAEKETVGKEEEPVEESKEVSEEEKKVEEAKEEPEVVDQVKNVEESEENEAVGEEGEDGALMKEDGLIVLDEIGEEPEEESTVNGEKSTEDDGKEEKKANSEEKKVDEGRKEHTRRSETRERSKDLRNEPKLMTLREREDKRRRCAAVMAACPLCGAQRRLARMGHHMTRFCPENKEACLTLDDMYAVSIRSFIEEGYLSVFDGKEELHVKD